MVKHSGEFAQVYPAFPLQLSQVELRHHTYKAAPQNMGIGISSYTGVGRGLSVHMDGRECSSLAAALGQLCRSQEDL